MCWRPEHRSLFWWQCTQILRSGCLKIPDSTNNDLLKVKSGSAYETLIQCMIIWKNRLECQGQDATESLNKFKMQTSIIQSSSHMCGVSWKGPQCPESLSYQKKDWCEWPCSSFFCYDTDFSKNNLKSWCHTILLLEWQRLRPLGAFSWNAPHIRRTCMEPVLAS